jgi:hypothetical protein
VAAAQGYDAFLQQVYGASFPDFAAREQQNAMNRLPADAFGTNLFGIGQLLSQEDSEKVWAARSDASRTLQDVHFEVAAESNGYLLSPVKLVAGGTLPALTRPDGSAPPMPIVEGPTTYKVNAEAAEIAYGVALANGRLRLVTWGDGATAALANPTVRLYVPNAPTPEGVSIWGHFSDPDWRDGTTAYEGVKLEESCLGAPCYEFDAAATEALAALPESSAAELFLSATAGDQPPPIVGGNYRWGRTGNTFLKRLLAGN